MVKKVVALDIGGTNIRCGLVFGKRILSLSRAKTPKTKREFLNLITSMIAEKIGPDVSGIGVGFPSPIKNSSVTTKAPNLPIQNFPLADYLKKKFRKKVLVKNDASCVALAEAKLGERKKNLLVMTLGTGIGGGIIINGEEYSGGGLGAEFGFMLINGRYLEDSWKETKRKMGGLLMSEVMVKHPKKAERLFCEVGDYLGQAIASLINIFSPDAFVLTGGPRECGRRLLLPIQRGVKKYQFIPKKVPIIWSSLSEPGLLGAGLLIK